MRYKLCMYCTNPCDDNTKSVMCTFLSVTINLDVNHKLVNPKIV